MKRKNRIKKVRKIKYTHNVPIRRLEEQPNFKLKNLINNFNKKLDDCIEVSIN